jgi:hypothetical protein
MAPIDGIKRLMRGVFKERPSRRANPAPWDPLKVLDIFQHWPVDLPLSKLMRKGAFLLALTTAKRAAELVALLCDYAHFRWEGENHRFVPSRLTKTDRPGYLTPPFYVKPWKDDLCVRPVETVKTHSEGARPLVSTTQCTVLQLDLPPSSFGRCYLRTLHQVLLGEGRHPGCTRVHQEHCRVGCRRLPR